MNSVSLFFNIYIYPSVAFNICLPLTNRAILSPLDEICINVMFYLDFSPLK